MDFVTHGKKREEAGNNHNIQSPEAKKTEAPLTQPGRKRGEDLGRFSGEEKRGRVSRSPTRGGKGEKTPHPPKKRRIFKRACRSSHFQGDEEKDGDLIVVIQKEKEASWVSFGTGRPGRGGGKKETLSY